MNHKIIDAEYSPSLWTKRFETGDEVLNFHYKFVKDESEKVRQTVKYVTLFYGNRPSETIDIYGSDLLPDSPIFIYIHGGYWQCLSKMDSAYVVLPLYRAGYKVAIVDYDLCPNLTLTDLIEQMHKAGKFLQNYATNIGAKYISFAGHSAGCHLILCMLKKMQENSNNLSIIKCLYLISGIYDLTDLRYSIINENNILALNDENINQLSPATFDFSVRHREFNPSIKIYVAEYDSKTFQKQSSDLYYRLKNIYQLQADYEIINDCDHFNIVERLTENDFKITKEILNSFYH